MNTLLQDIRYAIRSLRQSPGFATVAILTLGLGIGANTAIFSVVRGVLLKPLPHREGDRLVYLRHSADGPGRANLAFSVPEVNDFRAGAPSLGGIAEYSEWTGVIQGDEGAARIPVGLVTGNFFEVMGLSPILGRLTQPEDDGPGVPPVMVLTRGFWLSRFGGDSSIVGKQVRIDNRSVTVIGVVQEAPHFPTRVDALLNMVFSEHHLSAFMVQGRTHRMTEMVARLSPGATVAQARAEVATAYTRMQRDFAEAYDAASHYRVTVFPFKEVLGERAQLVLWLLMGAAAFVLLISAANVANLTLMRGVRREHELVARAALGAGTGRLRRLLLVENLLLALSGAGLGLLLAKGGLGPLVSLADRYSPRAGEIRLDTTVLGFTLAVSFGLAFLLSFAAWLPREGAIASLLAGGGRALAGSPRRQRLQRGLVVAQVAVSVVLLAGAGLLTRTMLRLADVRTGLVSEEILTMQVPLLNFTELVTNPGLDVEAKDRYERIRLEIAALPGVKLAGVGSPAPLRRSGVVFDVKAEGKTVPPGEPMPSGELRTANPEFFRAAGVPILRGREFTATDRRDSEKVVIINQVLADRLFPGENPVGQRVAWTGDVLRFTPISGDWRTVVGVAGNTRDGGLEAEPNPVVFMPFTQILAMSGALAIRTDRNAASLIPGVTAIIRRIAPTAPIEQVATISQIKAESVGPRRLNALLVAGFGLLAVLIAAVGIAGVLAFSVSARTTEIGIRMSLGADGSRIQRMILREGGVLLVLGLGLGTAGAFAAAGLIRGLLFGVAPHDPVTFIAVAVLMAAIGILACWIPAVRAARIDPAITMRGSG
ncbi:MAG: ABC transporter permease [Gemmatimonadales bacterium]